MEMLFSLLSDIISLFTHFLIKMVQMILDKRDLRMREKPNLMKCVNPA